MNAVLPNSAVENDASRIKPRSRPSFRRLAAHRHIELLQSGLSGCFGFWTGVHHAKVVMPGKEKPVPMQLRTTQVFRAEDGAWKLVHRHADMAQAKK